METEEALVVQDATCCTTWPVLVGVPMRACAYCGAVPDRDPDSVRTVTYKPSTGDRVVSMLVDGEWVRV